MGFVKTQSLSTVFDDRAYSIDFSFTYRHTVALGRPHANVGCPVQQCQVLACTENYLNKEPDYWIIVIFVLNNEFVTQCCITSEVTVLTNQMIH